MESNLSPVIRLNQVPGYCCISKWTLKRLVDAGEFDVPLIRLGTRALGVFKADLDQWLRSRSETSSVKADQ